jgi:hypothetical protein
MNTEYIAVIPDKIALTRLQHISPVYDLASVFLHKESFTIFEQDVLRTYSKYLAQNYLLPWKAEDTPDERSIDYICDIFSKYLPSYADTPHKLPGNDLAVVLDSPLLTNSGLGEDIDAHKTVLRINYSTTNTHKDIGYRTAIHMLDDSACYEFTRNLLPDNLGHMGLFNIFTSSNELASCLEYARFLDCGGDPSSFFVFKPSFREALAALRGPENPSLNFLSAGFALRTFDRITMYGVDRSVTNFETAELLSCEKSFLNFKLL